MAHLHLPAKHSDDDLAIAGALAHLLRSEELYVAWSSETGHAEAPVIPARIADPSQRRARRPGLLSWLFRRAA
jgi:hypothetical protein